MIPTVSMMCLGWPIDACACKFGRLLVVLQLIAVNLRQALPIAKLPLGTGTFKQAAIMRSKDSFCL